MKEHFEADLDQINNNWISKQMWMTSATRNFTQHDSKYYSRSLTDEISQFSEATKSFPGSSTSQRAAAAASITKVDQ